MVRSMLTSLALLGLLAAGAQAAPAKRAATGGKTVTHEAKSGEAKSAGGEDVGVIETTLGKIVIRFYDQDAPKTVANFKKLARQGFYDGTTFHRVIPGFMIQGGDPNSKDPDKSRHGMGGPGYTIKAEFNEKPHKRGALSMARSAHPDSAGSQFFICVADANFLDRQYTVFGEVVTGIEAVDAIVSQPRDGRDNPNERIEMKVRIEEK